MSQRTVSTWIQQWTCVGGTCAPPSSPPKNALERALDRYVGLTATVLRGCWAIPLAAGVFLVSRALGTGGLYVTGLYFAAYSVYCLSNFARCREAHCIITGIGLGALAFVALAAAVLQLNWFQPIWNAFLIIFIVGHGFELIWAATRHTHALRM